MSDEYEKKFAVGCGVVLAALMVAAVVITVVVVLTLVSMGVL